MSGVVIWITGLPSSGKSTLAERARSELEGEGICAKVLDGDDVRAAIVPRLGHDPKSRAAFYETLARLAALLARQDMVLIVAATAHRARFREHARALAPAFVEVWVDVPLTECKRRDAKGLYARAAEGLPGVPGVGEPYEPPASADVVATGGDDRRAVKAIVEAVRRAVVERPRQA